ncbi:MAG: VPLPA-CTERM-specific exosortase XrtD [Pseudomonas sp.]|nr:VPLPA-CTERM-specific exosortase XrtD [Pseudomonas sp.]
MGEWMPGRGGRMPMLFAVAVALAFAAYSGGLLELVSRWRTQEEYGHGFFIPLISLWLLWQRRAALGASVGRPAWSGLLLLLVALGMLVLGELSAIFILVQYGFLVCLLALTLCLGGTPLLRVTLLPLLLLIFAVPLPYFVDAQLSWRLQLLSSQLGVGVLRLLDISVFLEGNVIDLGAYRLQVVDACSGLRYLYPLLSIGFLMGYMLRAPLWQRALLFVSTIPITVLMNSLRIAAVGVLVERWGIAMADGFLHYFEGWIIFMACLLLLLAQVWLFERFAGRRPVHEALSFPVVYGGGARPAPTLFAHPLVLALPLLVLAGVAVVTIGQRQEVHPPRLSFNAFPLLLDEWRASESRLDTQVEVSLGLDDYVIADYRRANSDVVNFYAAYYGSQRKGVAPHSPQVCIPGGGWLITELSRVPVALTSSSEAVFEVNRVVIERAGQKQLVYYWFEQRGRRIASEYWVKWYLLLDALVRNRSDGALLRLTTPIGAFETAAAADQRLQDFIQLAVPRLSAHVPY